MTPLPALSRARDTARTMQALLGMVKLDLPALQAAYDGAAGA